jgi:glycosyltransferase involved in cell wall biosynthesis
MRATILVPTYNHGRTLWYSVRSGLAQSVSEIEIFIVGDGISDEGRATARELAALDKRVTFFDFPKGPSRGEVHRNTVMRQARGRICLNLSDDDLWLPQHIEQLEKLLASADFAHSAPVRVQPDNTLHTWSVDLSLSYFRKLFLSGTNRVPSPCSGWTRELYDRLPYGWRSAPKNHPTDLWMYKQILQVPDVRCVSGRLPTAISLESTYRKNMSRDERLGELSRWFDKTQSPDALANITQQYFGVVVAERAKLEAELGTHIEWLTSQHAAEIRDWEQRLSQAVLLLRRIQAEGARHWLTREQYRKENEQLTQLLRAITNSRTWRLRESILGTLRPAERFETRRRTSKKSTAKAQSV